MNEIKFIGRDDMTPPKGWTEQEPDNSNLDDYQEVIKQWTAPMDGHDPNHDDIVSIEKMDDGRFEVVTYIAFGDNTEEEELTFDNFDAAMVKAIEIMKDISSYWDSDYGDENGDEIYEDHQFLKGGKGDKLNSKDVDPIELEKGTKHEMEHTNDPKIAREIAMDHLAEDPHYYKHLDQAGLDESTIRRLQKLAGIKLNEIKLISGNNLKEFVKANLDSILKGIDGEVYLDNGDGFGDDEENEDDFEKNWIEDFKNSIESYDLVDINNVEDFYEEDIDIFKSEPDVEQVSINTGDCEGLYISNKGQDFWEQVGSGTGYEEILGVTYKGKPLYWDKIWC